MRRPLIALMALLASPALAAPPLYTYTFAVQAPYDAGSWTIWPGNGQLVSMVGKHFLLSAPQCDTGIWTPVASVPIPQTEPAIAINALPQFAISAGVTLKVVTQQSNWELTTKPLFFSCQ